MLRFKAATHRHPCKLQESGGSHPELEVLVRRHSADADLSGGG